jgi:hypothetical protein
MGDIKDFLSELKELNEKDVFKVHIPSINKKVPFKAFSVKQHKDIIKTALDGVGGSILVGKVYNDIIEENCIEDASFRLFDRNKILVDLRRQSVGDKIKIEETDYRISELPGYNFNFPQEESFEYKGLTITVEIPDLQTDSRVIEKCVLEINKLTSEEKKLNNSINLLLIYELIKFIKSVKTDTGEIFFADLGIYDRKNIVENLPLRLNNDVLDFITRYKQYEQDLLTFSDGTKLIIDASFLTSE